MKIIETNDWEKTRKKKQGRKLKRNQIMFFFVLFLFYRDNLYVYSGCKSFREAENYN